MTEELFKRITDWQQKTFGKATSFSKLEHLKDEIEEVSDALEWFSEEKELSQQVMEEYADCFLLLYGSASCYGMSFDDITKAIAAKMDKNEARKWGEPDVRGVVKHIKEEEKK